MNKLVLKVSLRKVNSENNPEIKAFADLTIGDIVVRDVAVKVKDTPDGQKIIFDMPLSRTYETNDGEKKYIKAVELYSTDDKLKEDIKSKYEKSISNIKSALKSLKYKKKDINEMIQKPPNLMVDLNNEEKSKKILDELKGLNSLPIGEKDLDVEVNFQKEIKLEQYESQPFEIKLPNNGEYIEGHNLLKTELDFIPNAKCTLNCQLLLSCYNLSLSLEIDYKFSIEHQEKYIGYLYLRNNKTTKSIFLQGYSTIKEVILFYKVIRIATLFYVVSTLLASGTRIFMAWYFEWITILSG